MANYTTDQFPLDYLKDDGKITIPRLQRGLVWTLQHKKDFIETVKSGEPFGVVLVWQETTTGPYLLIDGLQRLSTLKDYMKKPIEFIDENDKFIDQNKLDTLFQLKYQGRPKQPSESKIKTEKKTFLKKFIALLKSKGTTPEPEDIWPEIAELLTLDVNNFTNSSAFSKFYKSFISQYNLPSDTMIHAIVYQGDKDRLPSVFETLNTTSVPLTKYEVFASQWGTKLFKIDDDELIDKVWSKYDNLSNSSSFDVDTSYQSIKDEGITLFEFCFGFSEILYDETKSYSFLFTKNKKSTDPTGFELLALACDLQVNKANDLYKDEYLGNSTPVFLKELKEALIDSIQIVSDSLAKWVIDLKDSPIKITSTYQVYYMIISVFKHKYEIDTKNNFIKLKDDDEWISSFKNNVHKWYFYHQISGFWNQHRQVSDLKNIIDGNEPDTDYSTNISNDYWKSAITSFFSENRSSLNTRTIPNEIKLFLNYLYRLLIMEDANRQKYFKKQTDNGEEITFDIEHIVPYEKFSNFDGKIPMSVLGNLCYLPVKDNRSKGKYTIYEYAMNRPSLIHNQEFLDMIDYPAPETLSSFIDCSIEQFKEPYENMVKNREEKMINKFLELINKF